MLDILGDPENEEHEGVKERAGNDQRCFTKRMANAMLSMILP